MSSQPNASPPVGVMANATAAWTSLDPQIKSIVTTVLAGVAMAVTGWFVKSGFVPAEDQAAVANWMVSTAGIVAFALIAWWKTRSHTQTAQIAAVNSDPTNGVKVVAETAPAKQVDAPVVPPATK